MLDPGPSISPVVSLTLPVLVLNLLLLYQEDLGGHQLISENTILR